MIIRTATIDDAEAIRAIYAPYVRDTAITFEYDVPDTKEFERRIAATLARYPYLVAAEADRVIGYAYAGAFKSRAAYDHCVEVSIYIDQNQRGRGIGNMLYRELERILLKQNVYMLYACITSADGNPDEHITDASVIFHEKNGYSLTGTFSKCGYKFGKWYSMIWMGKTIAERPAHPDPFVPFAG